MPNFYVDHGFSTNNKEIEPTESAAGNSDDQKNESEIKENPEEKVCILSLGEVNSILFECLNQEEEGRDDVEQ